jgi:hypothetical protein
MSFMMQDSFIQIRTIYRIIVDYGERAVMTSGKVRSHLDC